MTVDAWTLSQANSLPDADNWGKGWTLADIEVLETFRDYPTAEVAEHLGRTVYAVANARQLFDAGKLHPNNAPAPRQNRVSAICPRCFLEKPLAGDCC